MKRLARSRCALLILVIVSTSGSLRAEDGGRTRSLSFATQWLAFDRQRDQAFATRLVYSVGRATRRLRGVAVAGLTDDSSLSVGAGVGYQITLGRCWAVTPATTERGTARISATRSRDAGPLDLRFG